MSMLTENERLITVCLYENPLCACEIATHVGKRESDISPILTKLNKKKFVTFERTGRRKKYQLTKYGNKVYDLLNEHDKDFQDLVLKYGTGKPDDSCLNS